jgi:hypothetical protein
MLDLRFRHRQGGFGSGQGFSGRLDSGSDFFLGLLSGGQ